MHHGLALNVLYSVTKTGVATGNMLLSSSARVPASETRRGLNSVAASGFKQLDLMVDRHTASCGMCTHGEQGLVESLPSATNTYSQDGLVVCPQIEIISTVLAYCECICGHQNSLCRLSTFIVLWRG